MANMIVTGTVIERYDDRWADGKTVVPTVVVDETKPGAEYKEFCAVGFKGNAAAKIEQVRIGDTVSIEARCTCRKGKTGEKWYAGVYGWKCIIQARAQAEPAGDPLPDAAEHAPTDAATDAALPF